MPPDVFSRLLKAKQELRRNKDVVSVDEVVSTFLPFLKVIASAKKRPTADISAVLSSALFDYIRTESRALNVKKTLATMKETPPAEELGSAKPKRNGKLDQVSDDCLRHALSFLTFKQRCRIESTYARLFHLSRTLPLPKEKTMDEIIGEREDNDNRLFELSKTKGDTQLSTEEFKCLGSRFDTLSVTGFVAKRCDVVRALKQRIVALDIGCTQMYMDPLLGLHFPSLRRLNLPNAIVVGVYRFLQRNTTVSDLSVRVTDNNDAEAVDEFWYVFWLTISRLKNISKLEVETFVEFQSDADFGRIQADCDFSHIAHLRLKTRVSTLFDFAALRPLLHAGLESLSLTCGPPFAAMKLPSLKQVELCYLPGGHWADPYLGQFFDALDAAELEACTLVHFPALDFLNSLHKCNARAVCYKMGTVVDFHTTLTVQTIDEAFLNAVANGITVKDFTLDISSFGFGPVLIRERMDPTHDYSDLVAFLLGVVRLKNSHWNSLRVRIAPDSWQWWEATLGGFADTLKPFVT